VELQGSLGSVRTPLVLQNFLFPFMDDVIATWLMVLVVVLISPNFPHLARDAALRRPVGAARRSYHGSAFRQFYANVCDAR
jgi:hypothetical protein